ncbi:MAG: excinuclease ABC subunit UvrB [Deltaproteobacteria bacterium]|nr:excinuclease ABC subunit UvrB [Deltaproteobacteria bacterium]
MPNKDKLRAQFSQSQFRICSNYGPSGDQPQAIKELVSGVKNGFSRQVLLGATGTGKTFTVANVIAELNRPALVIAHNKTLAAQLYSEFCELFPENAVRYFVSYYDYFQPEAYLPATDTYIEKDASINDEIDKLRHAATKALLERRDVIVVSSVSCIYGLGAPENYFDEMLYFEQGDNIERNNVLRKLVALRFTRNETDLRSGNFRVRGDIVEICPPDEADKCIRLELFGDELEQIAEIDRLTGKKLRQLKSVCIYPASHFVTSKAALKRAITSIKAELKDRLAELNRENKLLEAQRLEQRTLYDIELLEEIGFCPGIENYSRCITGRKAGEPPPSLVDYFDKDFIVIIDESHVTVPQLTGMYRGDYSRKSTLVEHGFRLPSAVDNRPLRFDEFSERAANVIFISATPAEFEKEQARGRIIEQINRPTGLLDPEVIVRPAQGQVDDFLTEIRSCAERNERALVTTLTKRMAEDLCSYYNELGVRVRYLHSDVHTLDRVELIHGLRAGEFDLLVGINLLREGLDLPEVSLVGVMDADKEGFLRSTTSLIQIIGRAARHLQGRVILYADNITRSINNALEETDRRRNSQMAFNIANNIVPYPVKRSTNSDLTREALYAEVRQVVEEVGFNYGELDDVKSISKKISELEDEMFAAAAKMEFEKAAKLRDQVKLLEKIALQYAKN